MNVFRNIKASFRIKLILNFGGMTLAILLIIGTYSYLASSQALEDAIKRELQIGMQAESVRILSFLQSAEEDLLVLQNMSPFQGIILKSCAKN